MKFNFTLNFTLSNSLNKGLRFWMRNKSCAVFFD